MKADIDLRRDVQEELRWEPSIAETEIGVAVKEGVVTLSGYVESFAEKYAAERAAKRVSGVQAIADDLRVRLPGTSTRTDTDLAHAAADSLLWNITLPNGKVRALVSDGWITLDGDVEWQYQRTAAERTVRHLTGVKGVTNVIKVKPVQVSTSDVSGRIKAALKRAVVLDADRITVEAEDGRVTLRGTVRSWAERNDAERAAWGAPGVTQVDDRIAIGD